MNIDVEKRVHPALLRDGIASSPHQTMMNRIDIASLNRGDELRILTASSLYSFSLTDPARLRGWLTGGQLGEELVEADLLAARDDDEVQLRYVLSAIGKGMRMIFYIRAGERNLVTSAVTGILLVKSPD